MATQADEHRRKGQEFLDFEKIADTVLQGSKTHPGFAESLVPVWGSAREAVADFQEGDVLGGVLNAGLAGADLVGGGLVAKGLGRGAKYAAEGAVRHLRSKEGTHAWRHVRDWTLEQGFRKKGQPTHHALIPQRWNAPDRIQNHPLNLKVMKDAEQHGRVHGRYLGKEQFNLAGQYWHGTPAWWKFGNASAVAHPTLTAKARIEEEK